ncbi:MAG: ATP-binding cassette domain-containing protein, partial [Nocardioidaceae bacterium]
MTTTSPARLQLRGISKYYGAVRAVANADLTVRAGTVHALVGENGAGKSTVIKIVSGAVASDAGGITFDGVDVDIASTNQAMDLGIATVYQ